MAARAWLSRAAKGAGQGGLNMPASQPVVTPMPAKSPASSPAPGGVRRRAPRAAAKPVPEAVDTVDVSALERLIGYNARRAALTVIASMVESVKPFDLRGPLDFSVLTLIGHNPGVTSRQLCSVLDILPPNLVGIIKQLESRGLVERLVHPTDGRAQGLYLTAAGQALTAEAEATVIAAEDRASGRLTDAERRTLTTLLQKIYRRAD